MFLIRYRALGEFLRAAWRALSMGLLYFLSPPQVFAADFVENTPDQARPPAYLQCSLKIGESTFLEGTCRVTPQTGARLLIEDEGSSGIKILTYPDKDYDRIFWNHAKRGAKPEEFIGIGQWIDNCWRSVRTERTYFYLCLMNKSSKSDK